MDWVDREFLRLGCPDFADEFVGREASKGLQSSAKVMGIDEVLEMMT